MVNNKISSTMNLTATGYHPSTVVIVPFFLLLLLSSISRTSAVDCGNCFCSEDVVTGYQNIICLGVPFTEIQSTFTGNTGFVKINRFDIVPKIGDTQIPARLLGSHRARIIHLASCGNNLMVIDRNAFESSATTMEEFVVYDCNVAYLVWTFLDSFTSVNLLQLEGATNIQSLGTLPSLPSLKRLSITDCKGFSLLNFPGSSLGGLQNLIMTENAELTDGKAESILATLNGASKLEMVSLKNNPSITAVPNTLAHFVPLHSLDVSLCDISSISSDSLSFSAAVKLLDLTKNSLSDISDDSFEKGYYGNAKVSLDGNQLTKFSSTIFLKILVEMQTSKTPGSVSIRNNPVKCDDCQMAWLIRDYRELLPFVSGNCFNATEFQDLNPSWYDDQLCEALTTTEQPTTLEPTTFEPTTTFDPTTFETTQETDSTSETLPSTISESTTQTTASSTISTGTTAVQVNTTSSSSVPTDPHTTTNPTSLSSGMTTSSTGSPTVTSDVSSTTTTGNPNSSTTTPSTSPSSGSSTTQAPDPPVEPNYDIFFYILYGVLGGIALILIIGFIFLDYERRRALRARTSFDNSSSRDSSLSRRMDPDNYNPRSLERRNLDPRDSYVRMPEPRPPTSTDNYFGNYPQSGGQPYRGPVSITTPYQQPPSAKNQPPPAPPTGRVRGLRRAEF